MSRSLEPADLAGITLQELAAAGQVKMLAALAKLGGQPIAVSALDELATMPDAFNWWWAAVREYPHTAVAEWNSAAKLSGRIVVPEDLVGEVAQFIVQPGRQHGPQDGARIAVLKALAPSQPSLTIARRIIGAPTLPDLEVGAAELLGQSGAEDRAAVVNAAINRGRSKIALLAALLPPLGTEEVAAVQGALEIVLGNLSPSETHFAVMLLSRLSPDSGANLLVRHPAAHSAVVNPLVAGLGSHIREWLQRLPEADNASAVLARLLISQIGSIADHDERITTAAWVLEHYPVETLEPYIGALRAKATSSSRSDEAREDLGRLLAASPSDLLITALEAVVTLADIVSWDFGQSDQANIAFGKAFAAPILNAHLPADAVADSIADSIKERGARPTAMIRGLAAALPATPQRLADVAVMTPEGFAQLVLARDQTAAVDALTRCGAGTADFVRALVATSAALRLEEVEPAGLFGGLLDQLNLAKLTEQDAKALADELRHRPAVLRNLLHRLMKTLQGPESSRTPATVLKHVMATIDDLGEFANWSIDGTDADDVLVLALTQHHDPQVRSLTATWLGQAPPTMDSRRLAIGAAESIAEADNPFRIACSKIASALAAIAVDTARSDRDRVAGLRGAAEADSTIARSAGLGLAQSSSVEIRHAAAHVLAESPGAGEDHKRLEEWLHREHNSSVRAEIATALRKLKSGDIGDALHNLLAHFDLSAAFKQLDANNAVPAPKWNDTFVRLADAVRVSATASVRDAVQAHVLLADLLVDFAVATHWLGKADAKLHTQARQILDDAPRKQTSGALIHNQQLLIEMPWLHSFAALRQQRNAHPKPGRTTPNTADGALRRETHDQTRKVVEGWAQAMLNAAT